MRSSSSHNPPQLSIDLRNPDSSQLRNLLILGFGGSVILHLGLIWGVSQWWRSPVPPGEPIEIVLVAPVEIVPVPAPPPPIAIAPKPIITRQTSSPVIPTPSLPPIVAKQLSTTTVTTPKPAIAPSPKPKPVKLAPKSKPFSTPRKLRSGSPTSKLKAKFTPTPAIDRPVPAERSFSSPPKSFPFPTLPTPTTTKSNPLPVKSPRRSTATPASTSERSIAPSQPAPAPPPLQPTPMTSTPLPIRSASTPLQPAPTTTAANPTPPTANLSQSEDRSRASTNPLTGANNDRQFKPSGSSTLSSFTSTQGGSTTATPNGDFAATTGMSTGNSSPQNGTGNGTGNGDRPSRASSGGLQCIKNCQIARLQNLQDSDGGKDRLRIRVEIDANGVVLAAEVVKSSGNPQIDEVILAGIKQMQFNPSGKPIKGIVRANIFL